MIGLYDKYDAAADAAAEARDTMIDAILNDPDATDFHWRWRVIQSLLSRRGELTRRNKRSLKSLSAWCDDYIDECLAEAADIAEYERDPLGYYGMSMSDFI